MIQTVMTVWTCCVVGLIVVYLAFVPDPDGRTMLDSIRARLGRRRT
jgi:hypothetical protein